MCEQIVLPDGHVMSQMDESRYKCLGIFEGADVMQKYKKEKIRKEYLWKLKLVEKSKLHGLNLIRAIVWAVGVISYGVGILYWNQCELKAMNVKTRKDLTMF